MTAENEASTHETRLHVWLEEYRSLVTGIGARVELQHKNANVALVLLSAFAGYIVTVGNAHGIDYVLTSPTAVLIPVASLLAQIFVWRHLDHDANIVDQADYIDRIVRPSLIDITGDAHVLSFEAWLNGARLRRPRLLTPLILLGNEHISVLAFSTAYLATGWAVFAGVHAAAGGASRYFDGVLYAATLATAVSIVMSVRSGLRFAKLASVLGEGAPPNNEEQRTRKVGLAGAAAHHGLHGVPRHTPQPRPSETLQTGRSRKRR